MPQWGGTHDVHGSQSVGLESFNAVYNCIRKMVHVATAVVKEWVV